MIFIWYCFITCSLCFLLHKTFNISFNNLLLLYGFYRFKQKILTSKNFKRVTYKHKSYLILQISSRYEVFYIRLGDNNENQCFPYSSIGSAAIEILQSELKLRETKMCSITLHWYFPRFTLGLSLVSNKISNVIMNFDQLTLLGILKKK